MLHRNSVSVGSADVDSVGRGSIEMGFVGNSLVNGRSIESSTGRHLKGLAQ